MTERCPFCGQVSGMIWVRAHYQCASCGQVVVPCCTGETASGCPIDAGSRVDGSIRSRNASTSVNRSNRKDA